MRKSYMQRRNVLLLSLVSMMGLFAQTGQAVPIITSVVETGGDNEATDTIAAKWTGATFPVSVANEPVPGAVIGGTYTVGLFGNFSPCFVDRNHRFTHASDTVFIPGYLLGGEYIMSGNDNRDNGTYLLDVTVGQPAIVYMLIDNRLSDANGANPPTFDATHMQWIIDEGWTAVRTGNNRAADSNMPDEIGIDEAADGTINQQFSIYSKSFPAGTFQLRQADNAGQNMYGAVVKLGAKPQLAVGLNFGADDNAAALGLAPTDVAGAVPQTNWNNLNGASGSASAIVADAAGTAANTTITVEWTSPNTWSSTGRGEENNGFPAGADRTLMTGYIDTGDSAATVATVTVSGIPAEFTSGGYDVLVYGLGGVAGRGGAYTISGETKFGTSPASPSAHVEDAGVNLTDTGTYVRFRGQFGSSFTLVANASAADFPGNVNFRAPINAIQLVRNSDPNAGVVPGYLTKVRFDNIGNSVNVIDLLNNPKYINDQYDLKCLRSDFSANDGDECDNCGLVVRGYFTPSASGPHTFYLSADDGAALFLSTDESPVNKVEIAREPTWAGRRNYIGDADGGGRGDPPVNVSAPIELVAGVRYYIEGAVKEAGGGDNLDVAVQGPGDPAVADGDRPIFGSRISTLVDLTGSSLVITQNPELQRVPEGNTATFTVAATAVSPNCGGTTQYQWQRNGVNIPGANSATLTFGPVNAGDHLSTYRAVVTIPGIQRVSAEAVLEVLGGECLQVVSASASGFTSIGVLFSSFLSTNETTIDEFNYTVTGSDGSTLNVTDVAASGGKSVILTVDPMAENTVYTVTVANVTSIVGSGLCDPPANSTTFRSWQTLACNGVLFETFNATGRSTIDNLINNQPTFPNNPRESMFIAGFDSRLAYADDSHEDYAARLRGVFIPPVSGNWRFHFRSDDPGRLYVNPTGASAAGKIQVGDQPGCCNAFPAGGAQLSAPFPLEGGKAYYVELLYWEYGGGDYGQVAVQLEGTPGPTTANLIGALVGSPAAPAGVGGPVNITQQPADTTVFENATGTFTVQADNPNGLPLCYQWTRDGQDIPGANQASYTVGPVALSDNNAMFAVKVSVVGSSVESAAARLTVIVDDVKPTVESVRGTTADLTKILVRFSELVTEESGGDEFNFAIAGLNIIDATLGADGRTTVLTLETAYAPATTYQVVVKGVVDRSSNEMVEATIPFTTFAIRRGFANTDLYLNITGVAVADLTGNANYPSSPDLQRYRGLLELNTFDEFENYGARMSGWVTAPVSGNYNFFMSSDDGGALFLSTDASPANKVQIASEPVWNGRRDWLGTTRRNAAAPENRSSTLFPDGIPLTAGQSYYFEALVKEGGGGDNLAVTWQLPGEPLPASGSPALSGVYLSSLVDPTGAAISITQQPADQSALFLAGQPAPSVTFTVAVEASGPNSGNVFYQWMRETPAGWRIVSGANSASLTVVPSLADNGAHYRVEVFVPGAEAISRTATLSVGQPNSPPSFTLVPPPDGTEDSGPQTIPGVATNIRASSGATSPQTNVLAAGDPITLVNGVNDGDGNAGPPPAGEVVEHAIDRVTQKYLNFLDLGSGFSVTPRFGASIVTGIRLYTANDAEARDPASYVLEGSTSGESGPWVVIAEGPLALPADRNPGGAVVVDPAVHFNQALSFPNSTAYTSYRVTFPTLKDAAAANSMQIGEVELLGVPPGGEAGQTVHFNVSNNNNGLFSVQPSISASGVLTYTPAPNACGSAIVTVIAQDDGGTDFGGRDASDPVTFTLNIACVCDPPVAVADAATVDANTAVTISVLANDSDVDGDPLAITAVTQGAQGTVVIAGTSVVYTPRADVCDVTDRFTYTISDGRCGSSTAEVVVRIAGCANQCPTAVASVQPNALLFPGQTETIVISVNGTNACLNLDGTGSTDPDGDALTYSWVIVNADGTTVPLATGATVTVCLDVGSYTVRLVVDDGRCNRSADVEVEIITASEAIDVLIDKVNSSNLGRNKRPFTASLKAAQASFDRGNCEAGVGQLGAFINKTRAQVGKTDPALAAEMIRMANAILAQIDCAAE